MGMELNPISKFELWTVFSFRGEEKVKHDVVEKAAPCLPAGLLSVKII